MDQRHPVPFDLLICDQLSTIQRRPFYKVSHSDTRIGINPSDKFELIRYYPIWSTGSGHIFLVTEMTTFKRGHTTAEKYNDTEIPETKFSSFILPRELCKTGRICHCFTTSPRTDAKDLHFYKVLGRIKLCWFTYGSCVRRNCEFRLKTIYNDTHKHS